MKSDNHDKINHPDHYTHQGTIECIEAIKSSMSPEEFLGAMKANVIKYLWRYRHKDGAVDLHKAFVYLHWLIEAYDEFDKNKVIVNLEKEKNTTQLSDRNEEY
jgi:Protein of unknwon function (DUF3310).